MESISILRCPPFELKRADEVERRMAADGIVEAVDVTADCARGFDPALEEGAPDEFGLEGLEDVSTMALSKQFPLPDIEIEMPFFLSSAWYSTEQYWLPRSARE